MLRLRTDQREVFLRFASIRALEVRRRRRTLAVEMGLLGVVAGGILGRVTLLGLGGSHWERQGRLLAPGARGNRRRAVGGSFRLAAFGRLLGGDPSSHDDSLARAVETQHPSPIPPPSKSGGHLIP